MRGMAAGNLWPMTPLLGFLALSLGCEPPNTTPTATIDFPLVSTSYYPGEPIACRGTVSDFETSPENLKVDFVVSEEISCSATPDESGSASCELTFPEEGDYELTLWVMDEAGAKSSSSVIVTIYDSPPIVTPEALQSTQVTKLDYLTLIATAADQDDTNLKCEWTSSLTGNIGEADADPSTGLCTLAYVLLPAGNHNLTVVAIDRFGKRSDPSAPLQLLVTDCTDTDGDFYYIECGETRDCNDMDAGVKPGAIEVCDGRDNNCNSLIDEIDQDKDGQSACSNDCDDSDPLVNGAAEEMCDLKDNNCDGAVDEGFDQDKDGFPSCQECDDKNRFINPDATEICDEKDNNCDGNIDEGAASTWYQDSDGDGYGSDTETLQACDSQSGYVAVGGDCDDADADVSPGDPEVCNGADDDCDGTIDEGTTPLTWYPDVDHDGYGDATGTPQVTCTPPEGYSSVAGDCLDTNASYHPGQTEVCDGRDEDCDGVIDDGVIITWYRDADGDGYGVESSSTTSCDPVVGYTTKSGDCNDNVPSIYPDAPEQCNSVDDDCNSEVDDNVQTTTFYRDQDGDGYGRNDSTTDACLAPQGYVTQGGDCNDGNSAIHPGVVETCNNTDDDCDGSKDEGVQNKYYQDADGDGVGGSTTYVMACTAPSGYVTSSNDCNDNAATVKPGATELCDGLDNDCDSTLDEGLAQNTFYRDQDGDGYGSQVPGSYEIACAAPPGYVNNSRDCNDNNAAIKPGATEQYNQVDDDCDGKVDEDTPQVDDDKDGYSETTGDCNDYDPLISPSASETLNGKDDDCDGKIDDTTTCWDDDGDGYVESSDVTKCAGYPGAYGGNIPKNGDCNDASARVYPGAGEIFNGKDDSCDSSIDGTMPLSAHDLILSTNSANARAGNTLAALGDLNGDNYADFGIGAPSYDLGRGAAMVVLGPPSQWASSRLLEQVALRYTEPDADSQGGYALAGTDLNDDGLTDLVVGSPYWSGSKVNGGRLFIVYGKASGLSGGNLGSVGSVSNAIAEGLADETYMGYSLAGGDDVNQDGIDDLAVGVRWNSTTASGFLLILPGKTTNYSSEITPSNFAQVTGTKQGATLDNLGYSVAMAGDVNHDNRGDVLVGGEGDTATLTNPGLVYLVPGYSSLVAGAVLKPDSLGARAYKGESNNEMVGDDVSGAGDINGDGFDDFLIGRKDQTNSSQGLAYLLLGDSSLPPSGTAQGVADVTFTGETDACPCSVAGIGDIDGDGLDDFAIGVSNSSQGGSSAGAVYLFYGDTAGWAGSLSLSLADAIFIGAPGDEAGAAISRAGDINSDGFDDFLIGAPGYEYGTQPDAGRVFVMLGFAR